MCLTVRHISGQAKAMAIQDQRRKEYDPNTNYEQNEGEGL